MKKQLLLIFLLFITLTGSAQNNWKSYFNNDFEKVTVSINYTWYMSTNNRIVQFNNNDKTTKSIPMPRIWIQAITTFTSYNDELWLTIDFGQVYRYKNGQWIHVYSTGNKIINFSYVNEQTGSILYADENRKNFYVINNLTTKKIPISNSLKFDYYAIITNDNNIIYNSTNGNLVELNLNGEIKNSIPISSFSSPYINGILLDHNNTLYVSTYNSGLFKIIIQPNDTLFQNTITDSIIKKVDAKSVHINYMNQIVIISNLNSSNLLGTVFNNQGVKLYEYVYIINTDKSNYYFIGFNNSNKALFKYNNKDIYSCDEFDWQIFYKCQIEYNGGGLTNVCINKDIIYFNSEKSYTLSNEKIIETNFSTNGDIFTGYKAITNDIRNNIYFTVNTLGKTKYIFKKSNNNLPNLYAIIPYNNNVNKFALNEMIIDKQDKLYLLMNKLIYTLNPNNTWDSVLLNQSDNIGVLYSMCKDNLDSIWIGTDKGIAKISNNKIVLQKKINAKNYVSKICYDQKTSKLIFINGIGFNTELCIYNLATKQLIKENTFSSLQDFSIDNNKKVYVSTGSEVLRYDIGLLKWDTIFNNQIKFTAFQIPPDFMFCDSNNNVYLVQSVGGLYEINVFNPNGFSTNISLKENNNNIHIYPNPTLGMLTIDSKENPQTYIVYNMLGEVLANGKIKDRKIDISELPSGVYTVKVVGDKGESYRRVIRN